MISVVIPLYNKASHIVRTLDSVLAQTVAPAEIIVVDDGSTDGGGEIVTSTYGSKVTLIRQTNQGVSAARNRGVEAVSTPYVAFLDADDEWRDNHLQTLKGLIEACPTAVLYSSAHLISREGRIYRPRSVFTEGWRGYVEDFFSAYAKDLSLVNSSTACVQVAAFKYIGGFPVGMIRGEDIVAWVKLALHGRVAHVEIPTAIYHQDAENRTDRLKETESPGSLQYLSKLLADDQLPSNVRASATKLFERISFFTAAGFAMRGDSLGLAAIRRLAWQHRHIRLTLAIMLLNSIPPTALRWARHWRHQPE